jgi:hypothetical protein
MRHSRTLVAVVLAASCLAACANTGRRAYPYFGDGFDDAAPSVPPAVIRQPVVPEMLVPCRGHVLVPALGMTFVRQGERLPAAGQYMREENLTPPFRVLPPGTLVTKEHSPSRLNVELDAQNRIIGLYCG